jgi:signal transduction histidine kinase
MTLTMLAAAFYAAGYAFEVVSTDLQQFKLSMHLEYVGIPFVSTLWLLQAIQFTGTAPSIRKKLAIGLFFIPATVFVLHLTNDWHHLIYVQYELNAANGGIPLYTTVKGPWYIVHALYNYAVLLFGIGLFIRMYLYSYSIVRRQIGVLIVGAAAPLLCNVFFWFGFTVDLTPFGFAVSGSVYLWGIWRFNLLRLGPLAMEKVFRTIRDGVVLLDYEDQIIGYNGAAAAVLPELKLRKLYPAPAAEVLEKTPDLLFHLRSAEGGDSRFPFRQVHEGRSRHYSCSLTSINDGDSSIIGRILMINDITELKENEARLVENARQLTELNAFKDKLFTVVAHDIRDPIVMLVSLTELLGEELAAAGVERAELFREIEGQMHSTYRLVDNLLDWYRSQQGRVSFRPTVWNIRQVVLQALSVAGAKAKMKRIELSETVGEELAVLADKEMLDLILRNLLSNAIKYTDMDGNVQIGAESKDGEAVVFVRDNGKGIDEQTAEMLLREEPFFRKGDAGDDIGDTRFGLVLAREFVRINGGRLWFQSKQGEGATFWLTLPLAESEA